MKAKNLAADYKNICSKNPYSKILISERDFIIHFLNEDLKKINQALKTWTIEAKENYKTRYNQILKERENLIFELDSIN